MQTHELMAWLGPAADDLTAEQIQRVAAEAADIDRRYPDPDEQLEREAALSAVVQYLLGDVSPAEAARSLIEVRRREREAFVSAVQVAVMLVRDRQQAGQRPDKAVAARECGIDRMSLLEALGERRRKHKRPRRPGALGER